MARHEPEDLAVAALGGAAGGPEHEQIDISNLDGEAAAVYSAYARLTLVGRSIRTSDQLTDDDAPPAGLWDAIAADIAAEAAAEAEPHAEAEAPAAEQESTEATVLPMRNRPGWRRWIAPAAVAAAAVTVVGVGLAVNDGDSGSTELAAASLSRCDVCIGEGAGTARLVAEKDGVHLKLQLNGIRGDSEQGYLELWLLRSNGSPDPQSIKAQIAADGSVDVLIPKSIDTSTFDIVDISIEQHDGNPAHSGKSIVRGKLV